MPGIVYLDGQWLPSEQAKVSVFDRGFLFGDGVYEVIMAYHRQPFRLEQHLARLFRSLEQVGITNPLGLHEWRYLVEQLIDRNEGDQQSIYLQVTRGSSGKRQHNYPTELKPTLLATSQPVSLTEKITTEIEPCSAILLEDIRWARGDIKSTSLLGSVLLKKAVFESGADEGILHRDGVVTEGTASNVFVVRQEKLLTPRLSDYILTGITRDFIFELAERYQIPLIETDISVQTMYDADEIWLTSSTAEVRPVVELDGRAIGAGKPGNLWKRMAQLYQKHKSELYSCGA